MTEFRYFADPHRSVNSTWDESPAPCDICGETRPGYEGPYYGLRDDVERVCEPCLVSGRLAELGLSTNEPGAALGEGAMDELSYRTPHVTTWQDFGWPAHCDDFMRFAGEVGRRELNLLASDSDGERFLREALADPALAADWELVPPERSGSKSEANSPAFYLFVCTACGAPRILWDAD